MTNGELAFMALAEELNFTRAAEKIYMSQQGLSDHVKRLEKEYDTVLVNRKHVTGVNGFTQTMLGACITAGSIYAVSERIIPAACELAGFIIAYALTCRFVQRKEYSQEERYTKE